MEKDFDKTRAAIKSLSEANMTLWEHYNKLKGEFSDHKKQCEKGPDKRQNNRKAKKVVCDPVQMSNSRLSEALTTQYALATPKRLGIDDSSQRKFDALIINSKPKK